MGYFKLKSDINKLRELQALRSELQLSYILALKEGGKLTPEMKFQLILEELTWNMCNRFI